MRATAARRHMIGRRQLVGGAVAAGLVMSGSRANATTGGDLAEALAAIEASSAGRLGVAVLDTESGTRFDHRGTERFPMCSTFKLLLAGAVLARVDSGAESLGRRIRFERAQLVSYSPATRAHAGGAGMPVAELCQAAVTLSDNTAANLLLASIGGPPALTLFARSMGDGETQLDRTEPTLNEALPGDPRDTTPPVSMVQDLQTLALGDRLSAASRKQLTTWLLDNRTGGTRLRAGLPKDWRVGDKTGSGERGTANDVGLLWPPHRPPVLVAAYLTGAPGTPEQRDRTLAAVGRAVATAFPG